MFSNTGISLFFIAALLGWMICLIYQKVTRKILSTKELYISNDSDSVFSEAFMGLRETIDRISIPILMVSHQNASTPVSLRNKLKKNFRYSTNNLAYDVNIQTHRYYNDVIFDILRHPILVQALEKQSENQEIIIEIHFEIPKPYHFKLVMCSFDPQHILADIVLMTIIDQSQSISLNKMRSDFVAHASHELRTPLTSLDGFIQTLLEMDGNDPEMQRKFLEIMQTQTARMIRLTNGLLALFRVERDEYKLLNEQADLKIIIKQAIEEIRFNAQKSSVALEYKDLTTLSEAMILADKDQLFQIFHNLLENAIRYAPLGQSDDVKIRCDLSYANDDANWPAAGWVVRVIDSGPGIEKQHIPRLTERFYSADDKNGGTGLGLAIVKHLITRHKGMLVIDSKIGKGSCFSVWFPQIMNEGISDQTNINKNNDLHGNGAAGED